MRPVLFVACFTCGVGLMVVSGYLPRSAAASGSSSPVPAVRVADQTPPDALRLRYAPPPYTPPIPPPPLEVEDEWVDAADAVEDSSAPADEHPYAADSTDIPETIAFAERASDPPIQSEPAPADLSHDAPPMDRPYELEPDAGESVVAGEYSEAAGPGDDPAPAAEAAGPLADAGPDRAIWCNDELSLDGSASRGDGLTYAWRQTQGRRDLTILNADQPVAVATGLDPAQDQRWSAYRYVFELTVTDAAGQSSTDVVRITVRAAPPLSVTPRAERRFEMRDGYMLGHYESWATNLESWSSTFEITSPTELTFTPIGTPSYDISFTEQRTRFVYLVTVYGHEGAAYSWVELFVESTDRVPAIVQLGVNWVEN